MCRVHLSEEVSWKVYNVSQDYSIILPAHFFVRVFLFFFFFFFLLGIHLAEVSVERISKGAHMEQSTSTSLEAGKEDSRQKADYQEEEISYTRSGQPREKVSVLSSGGV